MKIRIIAAALAAFFILPIFSTTAFAVEAEDEIMPEEITIEVETLSPEDAPPVPVTDYPDKYTPSPFTPSGTGTVINHATEGDGKEFYTIMTPDENVFYLVIDRQRSTENVYFLNAVTEADLLSLAKMPERPAPTVTEQPPTPPEKEPEQPPAPEESGGNMGMMILIVAVIVVGGGVGWYFKIYKPKQDKIISEEDYSADESDYYSADESDYYSENEQDAEQDDSPPWYEDGELQETDDSEDNEE